MVNNSKDTSRFCCLWRDYAQHLWNWFLFNYLRFYSSFNILCFMVLIFVIYIKRLPEFGIYLSPYQPTHFNTEFKSQKVENAQQLNSWVTATYNKGRKNESSLCDNQCRFPCVWQAIDNIIVPELSVKNQKVLIWYIFCWI